MATKQQPARKRAQVKDDSKPAAAPSPKTSTDGTGVNSGKDPRDGITPVDAALQHGLDARLHEADQRGAVAPPPTPTSESLYTANEKPGEGGAQPTDGTVPIRPRKRADVMVEVEPIKGHFRIMRADGTEGVYAPGQTEMLQADAQHWYAEAHGVVIVDKSKTKK